jgi:hypothetical protein
MSARCSSFQQHKDTWPIAFNKFPLLQTSMKINSLNATDVLINSGYIMTIFGLPIEDQAHIFSGVNTVQRSIVSRFLLRWNGLEMFHDKGRFVIHPLAQFLTL